MISPREAWLARLRARTFDVLVIGGGIVGAGIARDAAMRGLSVALIEQGDFGSGTSSKTSKLIHGGLRYLEHGRLHLVFESLRERSVLRAIAPGLVHPLSLLLPVYAGDRRPVWKIHAGLWLYDLLARGRTIRPHELLSARCAAALAPGLRLDGLRAGGLFADCQMDDARLCLANILQAVGLGAACANYVRLRALLTGRHRLCGGAVEDLFTGRTFEIQARVVVNAAGPWADAVRRMSLAGVPERLAPTKGIHLVLPRLSRQALFVQGDTDARMLFILPWGEHSLVGTTEAPVRGPLDALAADAEEVGYLLERVNRVLPGLHLDADDVIATFAGARPLLAFAGDATGASRSHAIDVDRWGLVSVLGGKFTTYRRMAQDVVDLLVSRLKLKADQCLTDQVSLLEPVGAPSLALWQELTRAVDPDALARWLVRYGVGALDILRLIDRDPSLAQPVCPHHDELGAELAHAITQELACTVTDVLARRTRIAWSSCQGLDALSTVTGLLQRYAGTAGVSLEHQVEAYRQFLAQGLAFRAGSVPAPASVA